MKCSKCLEESDDFVKQVKFPEKYYAWCEPCRRENPYVPKKEVTTAVKAVCSTKVKKERPNVFKQHDQRALAYGGRTGLKFGQMKLIFSLYGWKCLKCGTKDNLDIDHVIPLSKGGDNCWYNIQPLCHGCNLQKFTESWDFRPFPPRLPQKSKI